MRLHLAGFVVCCTLSLNLVAVPRARAQAPTAEPKLAEAGPGIPTAAAAVNLRRNAVVLAVERVRGAVVNIHSERTVRAPGVEDLFATTPSQNRVNGMGTGIIVDARGYIVTNQHVVEDVNVIRVRLSDRSTYSALVVARDRESDLALLKIETRKPLQVMPLGTSRDIMVGETVIAVGNAYGYAHTVSVGIVSAINRDVTLNKELSYKSLVQTDASINPGNSGGPLVNIYGDLIGVNVAIRAGAQGIGFAIPVDTMVRVVTEMLNAQKHNATWTGLVCRNHLEPGPISFVRTVVVDRAEAGGPAAQAGLRRGDQLVQVGTVRVASSIDVERGLLDKAAGETVPVVVRRGKEEKHFDLVLQPADRAQPAGEELVWRKLGLRFSPVPAETVAAVNRQLHGGLVVTAVSAAGLGARAGIQQGDVVVGLHHWETLSVENVAFVLKHPDLASFNPLCFYIIRNGQVRRGWFAAIE